MKRRVAFLALFVAAISTAEGPTLWTPELSMQVKPVGEVLPSPDGHLVVWTETTSITETEKSESNTQIFLARADGTHRVQLTRGEKSANAPDFSPDGRFVFFASERSGKRNVYRVPVDGGEAEKLTDWKGALGAYRLSPDGKSIAFTAAPDRPELDIAKKQKLDFRVIDDEPLNQSLYLLPVDADLENKRPVRRLVSGPYTVGGFTWSPDGRRIAFETRPAPDADVARKADLSEVEIESAAVHPIAATNATETEPRYSPDGRYLAFVRSADPPVRLSASRIVLRSRGDGKERELQYTPDENPNLLAWTKDSRGLYFTEWKGTRVVLYTMSVDGPPAPAYIPKGTFGQSIRLNSTGTHAGLALQSSSEPVEAYVLDLAAKSPVQVSAANTGLAKPPLGETRVIHWKSTDGADVEGLLTMPAAYQEGKRYPMILNIHGGPSGAFGETFIGASGLYPIASFASHGYAVLRANPRGSVGYGGKFRAANVNDWGGGDYRDLMAGVDRVIAMGIADPNRLAVMGWSYGGYMTNWIVGQTHRFKAAATGAGLSNLLSMWGTNDIPSLLDDYFSGPAYEQTERYVKMSPLYYVNNVTTPTLILHGEVDARVPTGQGYELYHALKRRGIETTMVVYPRTQHGPQEPKFILDIMQRHLDWVGKHL
ncbi:MAG: S9 family peptidase [Acidobacteriota bacterium]|nr:S9 family peptidase [Acidobacteriota bacterium]